MDQVGRRRALGLGLAAVVALHAHPASATVATAIEGRVQDANGAPLPDAAVKIASFDMPDGEANLTTDQSGAFRLAGVPAGLYDIFVTLTGYDDAEWRDLRVQDDATSRVDIAMRRRSGSTGY